MNEKDGFSNLLNKLPTLPSPEKIKHPISLIATFAIAITLIVGVGINKQNSFIIGPMGVVVLGLIAGLIIWKYETIANTEALSKKVELLNNQIDILTPKAIEADKWFKLSDIPIIPNQPEELPNNLSMTVSEQLPFWNKIIKPSLEDLGFNITEYVSKDIIGKTYYFSESTKNNKKIAFITLDPTYFLYGEHWREVWWLSKIFQITESKVLVVISDCRILCDEALHEKEDLEIKGVKILFINTSLKDWLTRGGLEVTKTYLKAKLFNDVYE